MANDGQIVFEVTADGKHAIANIKDITAAIQKESKNWDKAADQSTENISNSFSGMLKKIVAGFSAVKIGKALLDIGKDALEAASALEEVQNVVDVTFGNGAKQIDTWAKAAGTQFGLTETQAKKFASTLGAMMKSSGIASDSIVEMSTDLAGLAADMASFYNMDFDTAFQKIRSGISGETEPLKQLGINMSVANLEAYALTQGISKAFNEMTQGEQTMLRYQYLMQATADAQGDFARTSDGYANSLRTLESNVETLKTKLGEILIPALTEATGFINGFLEKLTGKQDRTIIDDFKDIDLDTEGKLADIEKVASQARSLAEELDKINNKKIADAGSNIQGLADGIGKIDLDQSKAKIVGDFVSTLSSDITTLSALTGKDAEGAAEWLREIGGAADSLDPDDAEGWATLVNSIKEGLPGFENTDFGSSFFAALSGGFSDVEGKTSVLEWAIETLGDKTNRTEEEQALWLETCKQLVKTIPGLSSIINTETGEIKGGTQAVKDYIKAWEEGQKKIAYMAAHEQKGQLLEEEFSDLFGLELNKDLAAFRIKKYFDDVRDIYKKYGLNLAFTKEGNIDTSGFNAAVGADREALDAFAKAVNDSGLAKEYREASDLYDSRKEAYETAKEMYAEEGAFIDSLAGDVENLTDVTEDWLTTVGKTTEEVQELANAAEQSLTNLADYVQGVRDSVEKAVDSVAKGLEKVDYHKFDEINTKVSELTEKQAGLEIGSDAWKELENEIKKYNDQLTTTDSIYSNLESQQRFLEDYLENLAKAQSMGLSAELLASLSDGSVESAQYLDALVNDTTGKTAKDIDKLYQEVQAKKKELTGALTEQQLAADAVYQSIAEEAKKAVAALDLEGAAAENSGKTVAGIAQGIADHVPEVQSAVDAVIAELERLSGWGISLDIGSTSIPMMAPSDSSKRGNIQPIAYNEKGLDVVPFDGYLSVLHEGEGILTAEENRIWRQFKNGGVGTDYDTLGGVMRDNIKAGGNVYLDGRVVGAVISDQQGKSYRQLQRSGWQS